VTRNGTLHQSIMKKINYIRQQGKDCVVSIDGGRSIFQNCNANKLGNTLWNRLGPKYTNREMYKLGFIPEHYRPKQNCRYI